jgi:hypothetical protein
MSQLQNFFQRMKTSRSDSWLSATCAVFLALGVLATAVSINRNAHSQPTIAFDKNDWRVNFTITSGCGLEAPAKKECPANPDSDLWKSDVHRDSESFLKRYMSESGGAFWMGLKIPTEKLKAAEKAQATTLVLPKVNGTVQIWIDGIYQSTYDFSQQRMPLQVTLPKSRLLDGHDMSVALGVFPYPHQPLPERNAEVKEGFFVPLAADELARATVFFTTSQHLIAVALFLLVGLFLWSVSKTGRTRDYAVATQISLLVALITLFSVDLSFQIFSVNTYESIFFSLLILEAVLIARFTWTILAGSRTTSRLEIAALAAVILIPTVFNFSRWIEATGVNLMTGWILPLTYFISAGAIAFRLRKMRYSSKMRVRFLAVTLVSMTLTAIAYWIESSHQSGFHVVAARWLNLILLLGLVRVFTKSHQTKSSLIEMAPSSKFHRENPLPEKVEGWILQFNIQPFSSDRQVMSTVISHLWTIARLNEGEVIRADESSLVVLFTLQNSKIAKALDEMTKCVSDLEKRLPIVLTAKAQLRFRAAMRRGAMKPSFNVGENGAITIPTWIDCDGTLANVRELIAQQASEGDSVIVLKAGECDALGELAGPTIKRAS